MPLHTLTRRGFLTSLVAITLTACGATQATSQPTAVTVPTVGAQPTAAGQLPTAIAASTAKSIPSSVVGVPAATAVAQVPSAVTQRQPVIAFNPKSGGPGTVVNVSGWGFAPNAVVILNFGLPQPSNIALGSAAVDAQGRWNAQYTLPGSFPTGGLITTRTAALVATDEWNKPLASAPFAFEPAPPVPTTPLEQPTAVPQPTAQSTSEPQDGQWQGVIRGDMNGDGLPEQLASKTANELSAKAAAISMSGDARIVGSEITITEVGNGSQGRTLLSLDHNQINAHDKMLGSFGTTIQPAGFLVGYTSGPTASLEVVPLTADGQEYTQRIGIVWNAEANAFRISNPNMQP